MRFRVFMLPAVLLLLMGLAVTPRRGFAQGSVTATLSGTVFDSSGAVVPGATITAKNNGNGVHHDRGFGRGWSVHNPGARAGQLHGDGHPAGIQDCCP